MTRQLSVTWKLTTSHHRTFTIPQPVDHTDADAVLALIQTVWLASYLVATNDPTLTQVELHTVSAEPATQPDPALPG
ncbi:hypothetical protein [Nocardia transvalensis]|uniref:hypothetical protein n=1 Tax=Nocardia transvalensis TaxID=37333 RepID=UPI0018938438|nr:hypothetical protein [Nocardia transvalensis]MBF6332322.1 hypothetical protein [Nocardia transvalensis]